MMNNTMMHDATMMNNTTVNGNQQDGTNPSTTTNTIPLYVVQKCWYAGPNVQPAVDYLRLLPTRSEAEQIAYSSAHFYAKGAVVRTIQLPETGLGFVANGQLFWVRCMMASTTRPIQVQQQGHHQQRFFGEAHGILTNGIFGDNPNGRRRNALITDPNKPRVFVGPHSSHAALQVITHLPPGSNVQWIPVGMPPSLEQLAAEWPDKLGTEINTTSSSSSSPTYNNNNTMNNNSMDDGTLLMDDLSSSSKRCSNENSCTWFHTTKSSAQQHQQYEDVARPAKRACRPMSTQHAMFLNELSGNEPMES